VAQRILVLGGDGYLGWPTAMALSRAGHRVAVLDNFAKRQWELELGVRPLFPVPTLHERVRAWREVTENDIDLYVGDLTDYAFVESVIDGFRPDTIVHYGEQPSAPYSMIDVRHATYTQQNNVVGNLNVLFAIRDRAPETHLVKLGTMGEYGTPDIDIEEGYLTVSHKGREHTFLYPKTPGSMYHLSKVHDSHNIHFATRIWGLRATDLNQGVVYGVETDESALDPRLATSFHYDEVFGTALNRFCVQAVIGHPLTVYGKGGQTRGYLNIRDTIQCVALAAANPAGPGELRVYNQFTEQFSVLELAERVKSAGEHLGWDITVEHTQNPRKELEQHYYNAQHSKLVELGLQPRLLNEELIDTMLERIRSVRDRIDPTTLVQNVRWTPAALETAQQVAGASRR
jgi:UDP-sulfoquinovose synthase